MSDDDGSMQMPEDTITPGTADVEFPPDTITPSTSDPSPAQQQVDDALKPLMDAMHDNPPGPSPWDQPIPEPPPGMFDSGGLDPYTGLLDSSN